MSESDGHPKDATDDAADEGASLTQQHIAVLNVIAEHQMAQHLDISGRLLRNEHGKITAAGSKPQPEMIPADMKLLKHYTALADWDGVIASGEKVIADAAIREEIAAGHRKILALEMEGYGFSHAASSSDTRIPHLVIRGISDDASEKKDDRWHRYAAAAAAAFAKHYLMDIPLDG